MHQIGDRANLVRKLYLTLLVSWVFPQFCYRIFLCIFNIFFHLFQGYLLRCSSFIFLFSILPAVLFDNLTAFFEEALSFTWLNARNKMFILYLRKVYLVKYILHKSTQMECEESFHKKVRYVYMMLRIHWRLSTILKISKELHEIMFFDM